MIDYPSNAMFTSLQQNILSASYTAESACPQSLPHFNEGSVQISKHLIQFCAFLPIRFV